MEGWLADIPLGIPAARTMHVSPHGADLAVASLRTAVPPSHERPYLLAQIGIRLGRQLERRGILVRDVESGYGDLEPKSEEDALERLRGYSIIYRVAVGRLLHCC